RPTDPAMIPSIIWFRPSDMWCAPKAITLIIIFFFQAEDGIRDRNVTGVQTCALPICDLSYDLNYDVWTATVHGTEDYFVEINMSNFSSGSIEAYCDCPAFDTYGSCKHIVAVLISIANNRAGDSPGFVNVDYQTTNRFIQAITSTQQ